MERFFHHAPFSNFGKEVQRGEADHQVVRNRHVPSGWEPLPFRLLNSDDLATSPDSHRKVRASQPLVASWR